MAVYSYTFTTAELVVSIMINENKREVSIHELFKLFATLKNRLKKEHKRVLIRLSEKYLKDFKNDYEDLFTFTENEIILKEGFNFDDLREQILSYTPFSNLAVLFGNTTNTQTNNTTLTNND